MYIRTPTLTDYRFMQRLNELQTEFKLKDFDKGIIHRLAMSENDEPIAYGIVKKMAEAIILVNPEAPKISRAKAMRELMEYAEVGARLEKCEQLHCFVKREDMSHLLQKQFGFRVSSNICLVKDI